VIIGSLQYEAHQRNNNLELEEVMCEVTSVLASSSAAPLLWRLMNISRRDPDSYGFSL
jgi:hypothetical protein